MYMLPRENQSRVPGIIKETGGTELTPAACQSRIAPNMADDISTESQAHILQCKICS